MSAYSRFANVKLGASAPVVSTEVDAAAAAALISSAKSGGVISEAEMQSAVIATIDDYKGHVGMLEWPLIRVIDAAKDGRRKVSVDGQRIILGRAGQAPLDRLPSPARPRARRRAPAAAHGRAAEAHQ
jgi:hypothetical protein